MNISKIMKKKRDAEARLQKTSPTPVYVGSGGNPSTGGGTLPTEQYITNQQIINNINNVISNQLLAGNNITLTDNGNGTFTISASSGPVSEVLTDGNLEDPQILFADGSVLMGVV